MDDIGKWNSAIQGLLPFREAQESEVMLELTVPLSSSTDLFRVGWSLKGMRTHRWLAISTGRAVYSTGNFGEAALHMESLLRVGLEWVQPERFDR